MNSNKRMVLGTVLVVTVLAVLAAPAVAQHNIFHLVPGDSNCTEAGCTMTVWVMLNTSHDDIIGAQFSLDFDPSIVNITDAEKGTNPSWPGWNFWHEGDYVFINCIDFFNTYGPGDLELAKLTIQCEANGMSTLEFTDHPPNDILEVTPDAGPAHEYTVENGTFRCGSPETFTASLAPDWNLISLPLTPSDSSTSAVLGNDDCTIVYDKVYSYDASTNLFVDVTTGTMETGVGYFVDVTTAGTWSYDGFGDESLNSELSQGLNCIGWTNTSADLPDALAPIAGDYRYVSRWNAAEQKYEVYDPVGETEGPEFIDFTTMER
jgi:hypothetical protein